MRTKLDEKPTSKVAELKDRVAGIFAMDKGNFVLSFKGKPLEDEGRMIKEFGIGEGAIIGMAPKNRTGGSS